MSKTTTISIEVEFTEQGYCYEFKSPAGILGCPMHNMIPEDRMKKALKEVEHLLKMCEDVAAKEALREKQGKTP